MVKHLCDNCRNLSYWRTIGKVLFCIVFIVVIWWNLLAAFWESIEPQRHYVVPDDDTTPYDDWDGTFLPDDVI